MIFCGLQTSCSKIIRLEVLRKKRSIVINIDKQWGLRTAETHRRFYPTLKFSFDELHLGFYLPQEEDHQPSTHISAFEHQAQNSNLPQGIQVLEL